MINRIDVLREMVLSGSHSQYVIAKMLTATDKGKQEHTIVDRARDFEKYLQESAPFVQEGELIVGGHSLTLAQGSTLNPGSGDRIHNAPNYAKVLKMGFGGIRKQAQVLLSATTQSLQSKREYYEAVDITYAEASEFVSRHALLAQTMAAEENDVQRREELLKISQVCSAIATEPASSFREGLQLLWFAALLIDPKGNGPIGRLDQFLYPFYKKDIQDGTLTKTQAQELLECLWIKFNARTRAPGWKLYDSGNNIILGGVTSDGKDATNELTYMCLRTTARLKLVEPKVSVRIHENTPRQLLEEACQVIRLGLGMPALYNDRIAIPALMSTGIPLEEAREYSNDGCTELLIPGKSDLAFYICPMIQELHNFLFNANTEGFSPQRSGNPTWLPNTFEQLMTGFKEYLASLLKENCVPVPIGAQSHSYSAFFSAMFDDCLLRGIPDLKGGAKYNVRGVVLRGIVNCVDALAAIRKFVYDEKTVSWVELLTALKADFDGYETLRQKLLHNAPKFGNDDDYVDLIASELVEFLSDEASKYETKTGLRYAVGLMTWLDQGGENEVASADGRKYADLIASNFSPSPGRDKNSPTAVIRSVNKVDTSKAGHGGVLDLKFHPSALEGDEGLEKLISFVDAALKGERIITLQVNVVDKETLLKARENPEQYRTLLVRVRGFSAYFVELDRWMQEQIIERTELNL